MDRLLRLFELLRILEQYDVLCGLSATFVGNIWPAPSTTRTFMVLLSPCFEHSQGVPPMTLNPPSRILLTAVANPVSA
jgi:hypothetical protein